MPNTLYNAINGQEAKDIINITLQDIVNKRIPLLKRGNTFHLFRCRLRLDVWAVPEDVPTPKDIEFIFEGIGKGLSEESLAKLKKEFFNKKDNLEELLKLKEEIDAYLERYFPSLLSIEETIDDKGVPDNLRIRKGLPLHELELDKHLNRRAEVAKETYKPVDFEEGEMIK